MSWWNTLLGYISQGGFVMWPLLLAALLLWFGIGYRLFFIRRGSRAPLRLLVSRFRSDAPPESTKGYLDEAVRRALRIVAQGPPQLKTVLDDKLFSLEEDLGRYRTLVRTIVIVAPLLGLLGTVNGMIEMFQSLGTQTFYSQSGGVAQGISQALFTTQFGLVIAIPGLIVGGLIDRRERQIREDIYQLKELLVSERAA